jgi:hypothetical protein
LNREVVPVAGQPLCLFITPFNKSLHALHEAGYFGTTPLNVLFPAASELFGCEMKYYYHLLGNIRNRVKGERIANYLLFV